MDNTESTDKSLSASPLTKYRGWLVVLVVIFVFAGGSVLVVAHTNQPSQHNAMMEASALKKADEAKALKLEAAKASSSDAMMHDGMVMGQ